LTGKFTDPESKLIMDEQKAQAKEAVTNAAKEEGTKAIQKAVKGTEAEKIIGGILGKKDTTKTTSTTKPDTTKSTTTDVKKQVEDQAKQKIQGLLKKKKN
jgi:hypothetical protein